MRLPLPQQLRPLCAASVRPGREQPEWYALSKLLRRWQQLTVPLAAFLCSAPARTELKRLNVDACLG